jgi:Contractile injection system tube protein/LysM domain
MDAIGSAVGTVAGMLVHGKAKLIRTDLPSTPAAGGIGGALSAVAASLPIPGLGKEDKEGELTFMFNPTEYKISQSVHIERRKVLWQPGGTVEYTGTSAMTVSMQLFFDDFASAKGDVTPKISKLLAWQMPNSKEEKPPPLVKFEWGNKQLQDFTGVITTLNINYTVFRKDGTPLQAKVDVTLEGAKKLDPGKNPTSHAVDMRRVHTVVEGETIASVASAELGRPGYWRAIADANGIDDPLRLRPGQALLIPSAADAARNV